MSNKHGKLWKRLIIPGLLLLMVFVLCGCGASSDDATEQTGTTASSGNNKRAKFDENWYETYSVFADYDSDMYFEITAEDSDDDSTLYVKKFGDETTLYLTASASDYTKEDDGGYKFYDTGSVHSVMTYYPGTNTLTLMLGDSDTYDCVVADVAYSTDPYGFATAEPTWCDTYSAGACFMDIRYATEIATGDNYYEITIEWYNDENDDDVWEIGHGTYDAASGAIVFDDCHYYTRSYYADGSETVSDAYTHGSGSITMDENCRVYWNDNHDNRGEMCVFENSEYSYVNIYEDFIGTWTATVTENIGGYGEETYDTYTLEITENGDGFDIVYHYGFGSNAMIGSYEYVFDVEEATYDSASGVVFYLPDKYDFLYYDGSGTEISPRGDGYDSYDGCRYTLLAISGELDLYQNGEILIALYKEDEADVAEDMADAETFDEYWYKNYTYMDDGGNMMQFDWLDGGWFGINMNGNSYGCDFNASDYSMTNGGYYIYSGEINVIEYDAKSNAVMYMPEVGESRWFWFYDVR